MLPDYTDAVIRTGDILSLKDSSQIKDARTYIETLYNSSIDKIFSRVLRDVCECTHDGLSMEQLNILSDEGYQSVQDMVNAPDEVLLGIKGIGPARLKKIRLNR